MQMPNELFAERAASQERFKAANADLRQRLTSLSLPKSIEYDQEEDTLIITLGGPQEAITESRESWLFMRLDPETYKLVGVEIYHVKAHLGDPRVSNLYEQALSLDQQLAKTLPDLVPA